MAAKNSGGIVIAQVERMAERGTLNPPGEDSRHPGRLRGGRRKPGIPHADLHRAIQPGLFRRNQGADVGLAPMEMSERKIIARRAPWS